MKDNHTNESDLTEKIDIPLVETPEKAEENTNDQIADDDINMEKKSNEFTESQLQPVGESNDIAVDAKSANDEKIDNVIESDVNEATNDDTKQAQSNKTDEVNVQEDRASPSADVFDLLLENEDLFRKADETIDEAQKPMEINEMENQSDIIKSQEKIIKTENISDKIINEEPAKIEEAAAAEVELSKSKEKVIRKECLNIECKKKSDIFFDAPEFIINHFHLNKRQKMMFVCEYCYDLVTESYQELCAALEDKQPLFLKKIKYTDLVEIIDSSDEEDESNCDNDNSESYDTNTLTLIENELESIIKETLNNVDINQQMDWNRQILTAKVNDNEKNCAEMMDEMKTLQKRIDKLYTETYSFRHIFVEEVQSLDLQTLKPTQICNEIYPPAGDIKHSDIEYNTLYYTFRNKLISRWMPCKVTNRTETNGVTEYSVKFCREKRGSNNLKTVSRKQLAYGRAPECRLNIGARIIALFDNADTTSTNKSIALRNNFYPGVIAEPLSLYTSWRYLVFFDDGYVQYVQHENIRAVCECTENVWELIEEPGAKTFIEGYVKELKKKRPIVQVCVNYSFIKYLVKITNIIFK